MYVDTDNGLIRLEEALEGMAIATPGGPRPITAVRRSEGASWRRLELSTGIVLEVPSWRRLRSGGEWIAADRLVAGMPLYLPMHRGMFGRDTALHLAYRSHRRNPRAPTLPREWPVELAEFVGYFGGRGFFLSAAGSSRSTSSVIACHEPDLIEYMSNAATSAFGRRPTREIGAGCDLDRLRAEIYRYRRTPELDDAERERLEDIATRLAVMLAKCGDRLTVRRAALLIGELPAALIDESVPFLREVVDGQYMELAVESIEPSVAASVGLVVEGGQYLAEELVVGG